MCFQGIYGSFHNFQGDSRVRHKSDAAFGENNNKSSNSQVLTKILNYELIQKNQGCIIGSLLKMLRHCVRFLGRTLYPGNISVLWERASTF